jgi:hypothetical protein
MWLVWLRHDHCSMGCAAFPVFASLSDAVGLGDHHDTAPDINR